MSRRKLLWQLFPSYLAVMILALLAVTWFTTRSIREFHIEQTTQDLLSRAELLREQVCAHLESGDPDALESLSPLCVRQGERSGTRVTVIRPDGEVIADSEEDPTQMVPHPGTARPELAAAFEGRVGQETRYSRTLQRTMLYVAIPLFAGPTADEQPRVIGALRLSVAATTLEASLRSIRNQIVVGAMVVALLFGLVSWWLARRITGPLEGLRRAARAYAGGHLNQDLPVSNIDEVATLADSMSQMAAEIKERLHTITLQRNEREAILSSMAEGVLAVDAEERIVSMNLECARILQINLEEARGRSIQETVRIPALQRLVLQALTDREQVAGSVTLRNGEERYLHIHGAPLKDARGTSIGAVLVLGDVTRLHKLERMRRDFVANVSHELKTPITSIRMAVEALEDRPTQADEQARQFLMILARQAGRLEAIIDDLLHLSRIEQGLDGDPVEFLDSEVEHVLSAAIQVCEPKANGKKIRLDMDCEPGLEARINPPLLENALVNLIDNAIKYSDEGTAIRIVARRAEGKIEIQVRDQGSGIAPEHLDRIFERFYRVDKGRSRELGGTGLGLAIVKHIAQSHGGAVRAQSQVGAGSVFTVTLPAPLV